MGDMSRKVVGNYLQKEAIRSLDLNTICIVRISDNLESLGFTWYNRSSQYYIACILVYSNELFVEHPQLIISFIDPPRLFV